MGETIEGFTVELLGGPCDGKVFHVPELPSVHREILRDLVAISGEGERLSLLETATYWRTMSVSDDGRHRYQCVSTVEEVVNHGRRNAHLR